MKERASQRASAGAAAVRSRLRRKAPDVSDSVREWSIKVFRPMARFALRHWIRHDELIRIRQQIRYLGLGHLLARLPQPPVDLTLFELSVFSQNGEDGVLQEILRRIGVARRYFVEIGASSNESNCLLLTDALGWTGIFVDADQGEIEALGRKYQATPEVRVVQALVTAENFQDILQRERVHKDFDVLSIDVDGNDYWLWEALEDYRPRIVVIEYNASLARDRPLVQPNDPARPWDGTDLFGASASALRLLAQRKGYRLVYSDLSGTNAFFVRADLAESDFLPENEVQVRVPNYFLYGLSHRAATRREPPFLALDQPNGSSERPGDESHGVA
jgi:hypothetical protein